MRKALLVLLVLLLALVMMALPAVAFAQTGRGTDVDVGQALTWADLGGVLGAAAAATLVAQVMTRVNPDIGAKAVRLTMLLVTLTLAELVALTANLTLEAGVVAACVGLTAALAAMKGYETWKHGLNAQFADPPKDYSYLGPQ